MKNSKLILFILAIIIFLFSFDVHSIYADEPLTSSKTASYGSYDYVIDSYDVHMVVNEDNTFDITETITVYFNKAKHGIIRSIPLRNKVERLDGTTSNNRTKISNLSVNNEYTTYKENGNYKIQIGSASHTLTGEQTYVIKYTYNLGKDPVKDYDELYFNIIGSEWDTEIRNITFTIEMPKEFDKSKLGFSAGNVGSTNSINVFYTVNDKKITGSYLGTLRPGQALTVRCELDDGYFVGAGISISIIDCLVFVLPIIFLGISILIWHKFGRDDQVVETVEFYPPEGCNSLEVGFLYKGRADSHDVTSLLIYLANKGYIKITETEEKTLFSKSKGFKITKLKEYDGNNENEKMFLEGLFKKANTSNEVTSSDLRDNFYGTTKKILSNTNDKENRNKIFERKASSKSKFIILMMVVTYCLVTFIPIISYHVYDVNNVNDIMMLTLSTILPLVVLPFMFFSNDPAPLSLLLFGIAFIVIYCGLHVRVLSFNGR